MTEIELTRRVAEVLNDCRHFTTSSYEIAEEIVTMMKGLHQCPLCVTRNPINDTDRYNASR